MQEFPPGYKITDIAAGLRHSLAVTENGQVWSWGSGSKGQLGRLETQTGGQGSVGQTPERSNKPERGKHMETIFTKTHIFQLLD